MSKAHADVAMPTVYISGPMSGLPESNYPAFNRAAEHISAMGYAVENPAENPEPACKSWAGYMRLALAQLVRCDISVRLPGWENSRGAVVENDIANILGLEVIDLHDFLKR